MKQKVDSVLTENMLAITSLEAQVAGTESLEAFEKALFKRENHVIPLPPSRQYPEPFSGGFIPEFKWNSEKNRIPSILIRNLPVVDQLLLDAAFGVLARIGLKPQTTVIDRLAVIVIREQHTNRAEGSQKLETWLRSFKFSGPFVDCSNETSPIQTALCKASELLDSGMDNVLIAAASYCSNLKYFDNMISIDNEPGEGAGAIVISKLKKTEANQPAYALINPESIKPDAILDEPFEILELCGNTDEISSFLEEKFSFKNAFSSTHNTQRTCALGNLQNQFGNMGNAEPLIAMIKVALSLSTRSVYASELRLANALGLQASHFYVPENSRPWFDQPNINKRSAMIWHHNTNKEIEVFHMCGVNKPAQINTLSNSGIFLIPVSANSFIDIQNELVKMEKDLNDNLPLAKVAKKAFLDFNFHPNRKFVLSIMGSSREEILNEIDFAKKGLPSAFDNGKDWQTPNGSYLTPHPLGETGKIAFVYPGAFSSYIGLGRSLFHLFPILFDQVKTITEDAGAVIQSDLLYPRTITPLSEEEKKAFDDQLNNDPISMLTSGTGIAFVYTSLLREVFKLQADAAFGYSLGENSMMFASRIWNKGDQAHQRLENSPLFKSRLAGEQKAIREYWEKSGKEFDTDEPVWANYVLMSPLEKVENVIKEIGDVFITHINSPRQIVIGGDPESCQKIINALNCMHLKAPYNYAIHCDAMASELNIIADLHRWPINSQPDTIMYTAANYEISQIDSEEIAQNIGIALCSQLDFPRLTEKVYRDGARIFIEMGAGSNCAKWIDANLRTKPHLSTSINRPGTEDDLLIFQLIAKLISHKVKLDIRSLY
jgi:PfaB family protein